MGEGPAQGHTVTFSIPEVPVAHAAPGYVWRSLRLHLASSCLSVILGLGLSLHKSSVLSDSDRTPRVRQFLLPQQMLPICTPILLPLLYLQTLRLLLPRSLRTSLMINLINTFSLIFLDPEAVFNTVGTPWNTLVWAHMTPYSWFFSTSLVTS